MYIKNIVYRKEGKAMEAQRNLFVNEKKGYSIGWLYLTPISCQPYNHPFREEFLELSDKGIVIKRQYYMGEEIHYEAFPGALKIFLSKVMAPANILEIKSKLERILTPDDTQSFVDLVNYVVSFFRFYIEGYLRKEIAGVREIHPLVAVFRLKDKEDEILETVNYTIEKLFENKKWDLIHFIKENKENILEIKAVRKFRVVRFFS